MSKSKIFADAGATGRFIELRNLHIRKPHINFKPPLYPL